MTHPAGPDRPDAPPTYADLLAIADADAATTNPTVARLRALATATPVEDLDEADR